MAQVVKVHITYMYFEYRGYSWNILNMPLKLKMNVTFSGKCDECSEYGALSIYRTYL